MRTLHKELNGDDVKQWQQFLISQGLLPAGAADGIFGEKTDAATRQFQTAQGLEVDGRVGQGTQAKARTLGFEAVESVAAGGTLDAASEQRLGTVHPELARLLRSMAQEVANQMTITVASGLRSFEEQAKLFAIGRTTEKHRAPVTMVGPGGSYHNYGLAVDVHTLKNGKIDWDDPDEARIRGPIGRRLGLEWGGDWKSFVDLPHFQLTGGLSPKECLAIRNQGGTEAVWAEVSRRLASKDPFTDLLGEEVE